MQQLTYPLDVQSKRIVEGVVKDTTAVIKTIIVRKTHTNFQVAALTNDLVIFKLPSRHEIVSCWMNVVIAFVGPATYTMSVGPAGAETTLQTAQDVKTAGLKLAVGTDFTTNRPVYSVAQNASTNIEARATTTTNNLDTSTAGVIDFYISYIAY